MQIAGRGRGLQHSNHTCMRLSPAINSNIQTARYNKEKSNGRDRQMQSAVQMNGHRGRRCASAGIQKGRFPIPEEEIVLW